MMLLDPQLSKNANNIKVDVYDHKLVEELGQVKYIFSDKTGTLTTNNLELRSISIGGELFGLPEDLNKPKPENQPPYVNFVSDGSLQKILEDRNHRLNEKSQIMIFLLSICHSIYVDNKNEYHASSRDELAFVHFAKWCGFEFLGIDENDHNKLLIKKGKSNKPTSVQLLHHIELTSERKRMSVIVRDNDTNKLYLLMKGAEVEIFDRLSKDQDYNIIEKTKGQIISLSNHGLRVLTMAYKELTEEDVTNFIENHKTVITNNTENIDQLYNQMEQNMQFLGMTAVEDQLQPELPETLEFIKKSGVKIWVFTGDRIETTRSTAFASNLIDQNTTQLILDTTDQQEIFNYIEEQYQIMTSSIVLQSNGKLQQRKIQHKEDTVMIVSGLTLSILHNYREYFIKLIKICMNCKCVLACRASPKQKGELLTIFKSVNPKDSVLAIGDGANDVTMITLADVGIGIRGTEGSQAARASDFAIGEFKNLKPLMYIHGRENYRRNSMLITYTQWKNLIIRVASVYLAHFNMFSGQPNFNGIFLIFYQILYGGLSISVFCVFDREYPDYVLLNDPSKYKIGIQNAYFSAKIFGGYVSYAFIQGLWQFLFVVLPLQLVSNREDGRITAFWTIGDVCFWISTLTMNFNVFIYASQISMMLILATGVQVLIFILSWVGISFGTYSNLNSIQDAFSSANIWFGVILSILLAMLPEMIISKYFILRNEKLKNKKISDAKFVRIIEDPILKEQDSISS